MNFLFSASVILAASTLTLGCAQGNCRSQSEPAKDKTVSVVEAANNIAAPDKIKIYKYNGETQCGMHAAVDVNVMAAELPHIKIHSSESKKDNLMHIQQCGSPTGSANIYLIDLKDLPAAKKFGFKEWIFE